MERKINDAYKVSEDTTKLIECYKMVCDIIEETNKNLQVDEVTIPISNKLQEIGREIKNLIAISIVESICTKKNNHII